MTNHNNLIIRAKVFALCEHKDIFWEMISGRRLQQTEHLQEVADLVWASGGSDIEIASAWLHDMVEDTKITLAEIEARFENQVAANVDGLTDPPEFTDLPTAERKRRQSVRVRGKSNSVKRIKIADQTSNVRSLTVDPSKKWAEKEGELANYIRGAKLIADECKGISPVLDALFEAEYAKAAIRFGL